ALDLPGGVTLQLCEERGNTSADTARSAGEPAPENSWSVASPNPAPYADDLADVQSVGFATPARGAMPAILERLRSGRIRTSRVYDVGCGAGVSTRALLDAGYVVLAIEPSRALAAIARTAAPTARVEERSVHGLEFEPCEAILALGEPLTYHERESAPNRRLQQFFGAAAGALPPGGLLIFDLIETGSPALDARGWASGTDWAVLFATEEQPDEQRLTRTIETFRGVNGTYRRSREVHEVATFSSEWVLEALRSAGFEATTATAYGEHALPTRRRAFFAERRA
ncbi:MAG: methyltransferase domain-containing protein, partial [Pseudomonadota bacterium]